MIEVTIVVLGIVLVKGVFHFASTYFTEFTVQRSLVDLRRRSMPNFSIFLLVILKTRQLASCCPD